MCIYDSYKVWSLVGACNLLLCVQIDTVMQWECVPQALRAVGVLAGQQNLTERLKGVIKSDEPGGVTL
jgi:hypothetical protein